jgi:AAHS family 4-hydroxybenzoate transporter-like MFS transporter
MAESKIIDVGELVDGQRVTPATILFLVLATLVLIADGYDLFNTALVGPELVKEWHVERAALAPMLTASVFGLMFGAPLLGNLGDRIGRKRAIMIGGLTFAGFTLASMAATSLGQLMALRFLTGLGLGGVIPNVIALTAEYSPKRLRAAFLVITNFGVPLGGAIIGPVAALLVPRYGWQVLFLVGGAGPLVILVVAYFALPESIKYLVQRGNREAEVRRVARQMRPDLAITPDTRFTVAASPVATGLSPGKLFVGGLAAITPLLWVANMANMMATFFVASWLPTLLQAAGSSTAQAAMIATMFPIGGLVGGVVLTFFVDRMGVAATLVLYLVGIPMALGLGQPDWPTWLFAAGAGFCIVGINFSNNTTMGMIYPTAVRSNGAGWAMATGRFGSMAGPIVGGLLLGMHLPYERLFWAPAAALAVGACACALMLRLCLRRFRGFRLDDAPAAGVDLGMRQAAKPVRALGS